MNAPLKSLLDFVNRIYEAALEAAGWPKIVEELCVVMDAPKAKLFTPLLAPEKGGLALCVGIPEAANQLWATRYMQHDVWVQAGFAKGLIREGNTVLDSDLVPVEEFERSKIYREHLRLFDIGRLCSAIVFDGSSPDLHATFISVVRGLHQPFSLAEREKMQLLVPHFSRALGLMYRLRDADLKAATSLATLDRLPSGVILINRAGRISYSNTEAQRVLKERDGLTEINGRLAIQGAARMQWERILQSILDPTMAHAPHFSDAVLVKRKSGNRPLRLQAAPLAINSTLPSDAIGILFINDPERRDRLDTHLLRDLYGATPAEIRLAEQLWAGHNLLGAAQRLKISSSTARTHLASLFGKTGTNRQAELLRALMSLQRRVRD